MNKIIKILTDIESSPSGVYRKFMTPEEIKICNKLVKDGLLYKGKPDEKNATIAFFITGEGSKWLESKRENIKPKECTICLNNDQDKITNIIKGNETDAWFCLKCGGLISWIK